ncbi:MAG: Hsp70 family protein [Chloroflexi bacterium]|nr:Hsp70 family protein [Chloroflexota bacterium]
MTRAIGIDLGTTYTVVATIEHGRPTILPNAEGQRLTPSVVAFVKGEPPLVGQRAREQASVNPHGAIASIKRRMGTDYRVNLSGQEYTPLEIASLILGRVKADAEAYLGEGIDQAVITVPAYFNDRQRQATREAGRMAGLHTVRLLSEPSAAALAYGLEREGVHTILVWDLGGGTFDVSILELGDGIFEVRAVSGDNWLGGDDWDERIAGYLAAEIRKAGGVDPSADARAMHRLKEAAEQAKIELSSSVVTRVCLAPGSPTESGEQVVHLTREQVESLGQDLLERMIPPTRQALADAGLSPGEIDRVVLVGGATRMPAVRNLARSLLQKEPYRYLDPDETVALGAAIHAGMLLGILQKAVLLDVLPLTLGVETQGNVMAPIIPRNTPLPASGARLFTTAVDHQTSMDIHVLQGEREMAVDNVSIGWLHLNDLPAAPRGAVKVEVAFEADVDGIIHVSATDLLGDNQVKARLTSTKHLDRGEIEALVREAPARASDSPRP